MPTMIQRAALHFHHMDMGVITEMRSYEYDEAVKLRAELIAAGFTESEVDSNGPLDRADYFEEDEEDEFNEDDEDAAEALEGASDASQDLMADHLTAQLASSPAELTVAVRTYLEEDPEGVLMVAADGMDALVLELHGPERVVWFAPDGEVKAAATSWVVLTLAGN